MLNSQQTFVDDEEKRPHRRDAFRLGSGPAEGAAWPEAAAGYSLATVPVTALNSKVP